MATPTDRSSEFQAALDARGSQKYLLRLYVAGMTPRSMEAIASIRKICDEYLQGRYEIEVVDIYRHPERAREEHVIAAPTLVKELPLPLHKLIGRLTDEDRVLKGLDILPQAGD